MRTSMILRNRHFAGIAVAISAALLAGCPIEGVPNGDQVQYDLGFTAGFAQDDEYWKGFFDSIDTVDGGPVYYRGSQIPIVETPAYDAGFYDGVWYAYNDGYFVAYDYAFTIGFSEGYDVTYYHPNWETFLLNDVHEEWLDGGFTDGYNDGFSEGRIFGAADREDGYAYDWLAALLEYREGVDIDFPDLGVGTGNYGPVYLYEYGTDPNDLFKNGAKARLRNPDRPVPSIRNGGPAKADTPALSFRALTPEARGEFSGAAPALSPRSDRTLTLKTTWLQRVEAYRGAIGQ